MAFFTCIASPTIVVLVDIIPSFTSNIILFQCSLHRITQGYFNHRRPPGWYQSLPCQQHVTISVWPSSHAQLRQPLLFAWLISIPSFASSIDTISGLFPRARWCPTTLFWWYQSLLCQQHQYYFSVAFFTCITQRCATIVICLVDINRFLCQASILFQCGLHHLHNSVVCNSIIRPPGWYQSSLPASILFQCGHTNLHNSVLCKHRCPSLPLPAASILFWIGLFNCNI